MIVTMAIVSMMIILTGLEMMTTTGLNSKDNKTESNCSFNKKSNHDGGSNCAVDDETSKCHPIELIFDIDRMRHYSDESTRIAATRVKHYLV
jgi:hypothetical protein